MKRELIQGIDHIITHANCPDGIASAMILHAAFPDARVSFMHYGSPELAALGAAPGQLWCDFSPPAERAQAFVDTGAIVLDHHKSAEPVVRMFGERGVFADESAEPGVCGAVLAWREVWCALNPHSHNTSDARRIEHFARLAGVRDTWQTQDPHWFEACAQAEALTFFGADHFLGDIANSGYLEPDDHRFGALLLEKKLEAAKSMAERAHIVGRVAIFNERYASDTAEALRQLCPELQLAVGFAYVGQIDRSVMLVFSLRALSDDVDCAKLAKANGGGGHTKAAGFQLSCNRVVATGLDPVSRFIQALEAADMASLAL